jgi:hypothetical protein
VSFENWKTEYEERFLAADLASVRSVGSSEPQLHILARSLASIEALKY